MDSELPKGKKDDDSSRKKTANHKGKSNWKKAEIVAVFAIIEIISLVLWQKAEDFSGVSAKYIHWVSECGFLVGGAYLAHEFTKKRMLIWFSYGMLCVVLLLTKSVEPRPHFIFSLQIGNSFSVPIILTNDCFFRAGMVNVTHSNGFVLFNGIANGAIVIPMQPGESNKAFSFIAENDSPLKVNDLEIVVGFPDDWELGLDSTKWHAVGEHLIIPGWRLEVTNLQFLGAQSPWPLFPSDSLAFPPITNFSIPKFNNPSNRAGMFRLTARATGFQYELNANLLFIQVPSNIFRPFVTGMKMETNGFWHPSISQKELEDSQK